MIDDQHVDRTSRRFDFQAELLFPDTPVLSTTFRPSTPTSAAAASGIPTDVAFHVFCVILLPPQNGVPGCPGDGRGGFLGSKATQLPSRAGRTLSPPLAVLIT